MCVVTNGILTFELNCRKKLVDLQRLLIMMYIL